MTSGLLGCYDQLRLKSSSQHTSTLNEGLHTLAVAPLTGRFYGELSSRYTYGLLHVLIACCWPFCVFFRRQRPDPERGRTRLVCRDCTEWLYTADICKHSRITIKNRTMSNDVPQLVIFWLMQCQQLDKKQINTLGNIRARND